MLDPEGANSPARSWHESGGEAGWSPMLIAPGSTSLRRSRRNL